MQDFLRGYISIEYNGNIVVIKTFSGHADSVSNALDSLNMEELLGTIAGENCIFACLREGVTAGRALGYAQVIAALDAGGTADAIERAREATFVGTRRYVRRQRSWFRRDHRIVWLDGSAAGLADEVVARWHGIT